MYDPSYKFAFDENEWVRDRQTIDESKRNKWQLSISRINLMIFDTILFILSFMKLAAWSAFTAQPGWMFIVLPSLKGETNNIRFVENSFPHHWFFDYTLQTLETMICCWLISCRCFNNNEAVAIFHFYDDGIYHRLGARGSYIPSKFVIGNTAEKKASPFFDV